MADLFAKLEAAVAANRLDEAEAMLEAALRARPRAAELLNALGVLRTRQDRLPEAEAAFREALVLEPGMSGAWTNLGNLMTRIGRDETAIECQNRAVALQGESATTWFNLGITLGRAERHAEAAQALSRAAAMPRPHPQARWNLARHLLADRQWERGWAEHEVRLENGMVAPVAAPGRRWDGRPFPAQTLLVLTEQGFGDNIWAARFLPRVRALGGRVLVQAQPRLRPLLEGAGIETVPREGALPAAEWHIHICSLPGLFPGAFDPEPYLRADPARVERMRPHIQGQGVKVGIVWSGSLSYKTNHWRAAPFRHFVEAFLLPGVRLFSLQMGPPEREMHEHPLGRMVQDLSPHQQDFADAAAAVELLDLIVMTDSAVAHLAGAMGKPVWLLLGRAPHWLWEKGREDCDWYPTMRLFRQKAAMLEWQGVFDSAAAELMRMAASRATA
jgi:hypothetical protein